MQLTTQWAWVCVRVWSTVFCSCFLALANVCLGAQCSLRFLYNKIAEKLNISLSLGAFSKPGPGHLKWQLVVALPGQSP